MLKQKKKYCVEHIVYIYIYMHILYNIIRYDILLIKKNDGLLERISIIFLTDIYMYNIYAYIYRGIVITYCSSNFNLFSQGFFNRKLRFARKKFNTRCVCQHSVESISLGRCSSIIFIRFFSSNRSILAPNACLSSNFPETISAPIVLCKSYNLYNVVLF